jgi:GLPGLI family protein
MKKFVSMAIALMLLSLFVTKGQENTQGTVVYEEVAKIEIKLEGEMAHLMKDMPKERRSEMILYFNSEASVYKTQEEEEEDINMAAEAGMRIMMSQPDNILHLDLAKKEMVEQLEFMTRTFLINSEMPDIEWKITGQQKMILDFPCMEATQTDTSGIVTSAWFTPSIPVQSGPAKYFNLPGLVLEVDKDNGQMQFVARSVNFDAPDKALLKKPKDGKKVTREEYNKIVEEKLKEMGGSTGGDGVHNQVIIRIKH